MKAMVLGSGGWGTALALLLRDNGHAVLRPAGDGPEGGALPPPGADLSLRHQGHRAGYQPPDE